MNAEIISVGNELILGSTLNTNTYYLTKRLYEIGINVLYHTTVEDDPDILKNVINIGLSRADLLIFTGGLGPTGDDLTKEIVSKSLDLNLVLNKKIEAQIKSRFNKVNRTMSLNNIKQAYIPEGSKILNNEIGTAPGIYIEWNKKIIVLLPGPPNEMKLMFNKYVISLIQQNFIIKKKTIKTIGISESQLESVLKDIIDSTKNPSIATYAKNGIVDVQLVAKGDNSYDVNTLLNSTIEKIKEKVSEYIYSYEDVNIEEVIFNILKERKMKIAFSESCTGGLISTKFTQIPGVSEVFDRGFVTYSNKSKIEELGVKKETLMRYGPVSKEVALEMSKGLLSKIGVDIALSITGLAGPSNGNESKPVGLVYICISTNEDSKIIESNFSGSRVSIQNKAALKAFNELRKFLLTI